MTSYAGAYGGIGMPHSLAGVGTASLITTPDTNRKRMNISTGEPTAMTPYPLLSGAAKMKNDSQTVKSPK
jgi:hypothetical protein